MNALGEILRRIANRNGVILEHERKIAKAADNMFALFAQWQKGEVRTTDLVNAFDEYEHLARKL